MSNNRRDLTQLWAAPIALGILSAVGLFAALLSDGIGDLLSWVALAMPVAVVVWYMVNSP